MDKLNAEKEIAKSGSAIMYKPKSTKDVYTDSLSINSGSLAKQLAEQSVSTGEINNIIQEIEKKYNENLNGILEQCNRDMMALERVPSPLRLFINCLEYIDQSFDLSPRSRALIKQYTSAWEDWM
jgi:hypothetical protein